MTTLKLFDESRIQFPWLNFTRPNQKRNFSKLFYTFCCLLVGLLFQSSIAFGQMGTTTDPSSLGCTAKDIKVDSAVLVDVNGQRYVSTDFVPGNTYTIYLQINFDVTASTRYGFLITGNVLLDGTTSVAFAQCFFPGTDGSLDQGPHSFILSNPITWTAGTSIQLTNVFTAWQNQTGDPTICSLYDPNAGTYDNSIQPHCKSYGPSEPIPVIVPLIANFSYEATCVAANAFQTVNFTDKTIGGTTPYSYVWDFGDGVGTSTDANPSYTYTAAGDYTVTLTVTDNSSTVQVDDQSYKVTVSSCCIPPQVTDPTDQTACPGTNATFSIPDVTGATYQWKVSTDGGSTWNDITPDASNGADTRSLTVSNVTASMNGYKYEVVVTTCTSVTSNPATLTVTAVSDAPTVTSPVYYCKGATASALTATGDNLLWYSSATGGTGSTTAPTPSTSVAGSTDYYVSQTQTGKCESGRAKITVIVKDISDKPIVVSPVYYCKGATASALTATGNNLLWYSSATGGTGSSTAPTPSTSVVGSTDYYVSQTQANKCESDRAKITVTINDLPVCTISGPSTLIVGQSGTYQTIYTGTGNESSYTYGWSVRNGATILASGKSSSITYQFNSSGSFTVYDTVTNTATHCYSTCSAPVTVNSIAVATRTQGFYGNYNGKNCSNVPSFKLEQSVVTKDTLFGIGIKSFTLKTKDTIGGSKGTSNLYKMLPGGSTPAVLKSTTGYSTASYDQSATWPAVPITKGSITNVLLAQEIALYFNIGLTPSLSSVTITGNKISLTKLSCTGASIKDSSVLIPCTVFNYWRKMSGGATILNLYKLADSVLGNTVTKITASDMNAALNAINVGFDGGAKITAMSVSSCTLARPAINPVNSETITSSLSVTAYPNPFTDKVKFAVVSPVSGKATLDVFNVMGQKLHTVFQGYLFAGTKQTIDYNVPSTFKGSLIYTLKVGDKQVNGKVIQIK